MKIVLLAPFGVRPKGTVIARMLPLAAALQKLGHVVVIIAPPYTNPEDSGRVEILGGVTVRNIKLGPASRVLGTVVLSWRMFSAARAERPDLVHLFKPKGYGGFAALLQIVLKRVGTRLPPLLVDTDDWEGRGGMNQLQPYSFAERIIFQLQEQLLLSWAAAVTVASRTLQTKVWGMGRAPGQVFYLPNCVEDVPPGDAALVRRKHGIAPDAPVVLLYTRFFEFSQEKLHALCSAIAGRVPAVRVLVVGAGRNGEESLLADYCRSVGLGSSLVMAGWLEPSEIPSYLAAADVALYPFSDNLLNRAKCPAKLTEILRAGVPVVADRVGQLAEYIKPGVSGVLCDPDDWPEMAENAIRLLNDRETARQLGAAGRGYLLDRFDWNTYAAGLERLYLAVADSGDEGKRL